MNKVILMGRLVKDIEIRYNNNSAVAKFTLAVNRRFSKENQADFIKCVAFNKTAEFIEKYFTKGQMMSIVGRIQTGSWKDQQGNTRQNTDVVVEEVYFTGNKAGNTGGVSQSSAQNNAGNGNGRQRYQNNQGYQNNQRNQNGQMNGNGFHYIDEYLEDDELPF